MIIQPDYEGQAYSNTSHLPSGVCFLCFNADRRWLVSD